MGESYLAQEQVLWHHHRFYHRRLGRLNAPSPQNPITTTYYSAKKVSAILYVFKKQLSVSRNYVAMPSSVSNQQVTLIDILLPDWQTLVSGLHSGMAVQTFGSLEQLAQWGFDHQGEYAAVYLFTDRNLYPVVLFSPSNGEPIAFQIPTQSRNPHNGSSFLLISHTPCSYSTIHQKFYLNHYLISHSSDRSLKCENHLFNKFFN